VLAGHTASGARLIRWLEDGDPSGLDALRALYPRSGGAHIVGITGPPGAGKSTLVDALIAEWRKRGKTVAVLAVDPTSPFSGGAILGDRVRMQRHSVDRGVFIRSMATRGQLGGIARATWEASIVFDAMGFDIVAIETVGVGQDELDVVKLAHTTAVVCLPGTGDSVQALKAGILEVGDCLVLNKADQPGADSAERDLVEMLHLRGEDPSGFLPRLLRTVASREHGIGELADAIEAHRAHGEASGAFGKRSREQARAALLERVREGAARRILGDLSERADVREALRAVDAREQDPYSAADQLVATFLSEKGPS
jgi:LAO/AO transport system kinase